MVFCDTFLCTEFPQVMIFAVDSHNCKIARFVLPVFRISFFPHAIGSQKIVHVLDIEGATESIPKTRHKACACNEFAELSKVFSN